MEYLIDIVLLGLLMITGFAIVRMRSLLAVAMLTSIYSLLSASLFVVLDILSWVCLLGGAIFLLIGAIGVLRFPDFYTRLHAVSICDTLGAGLVLIGLMLQGGLSLETVKLILMFYFMIFTGPTAVHALAEAALQGKLKPLVDNRES
jgi:multicomponent Na+:H+ antiporter subunit G